MQAVGISVAHWAGGGGTVVLHCHRAALALSTAVAPLGKEGESFPALTQSIIFGSYSASNYERALVTLPCPVLRPRTSKIYFTCKGTAVCPMHKFGSFKGSVGTRQGQQVLHADFSRQFLCKVCDWTGHCAYSCILQSLWCIIFEYVAVEIVAGVLKQVIQMRTSFCSYSGNNTVPNMRLQMEVVQVEIPILITWKVPGIVMMHVTAEFC